MKKALLTLLTMACAVSVFAQGTILFNNRVSGVFDERIYGLSTDPFQQIQGPMATTDFAGAARLEGTGFTAELYGAPSGYTFDPLSDADSTRALTPTLGFRTGTAAGILVTPAPTVAVPGVPENASAQLQLRVWDNQGGNITSWAMVLADPGIARGWSSQFTSLPLGGTLTTPPNMVGLEAFNLFIVPEPSILALGALGIGALILFRRRK